MESTEDLGVRVRCETGSESGVGEVGVDEKKRGKAFDLTSCSSDLPFCVSCVSHEFPMSRIGTNVIWMHTLCVPVPSIVFSK